MVTVQNLCMRLWEAKVKKDTMKKVTIILFFFIYTSIMTQDLYSLTSKSNVLGVYLDSTFNKLHLTTEVSAFLYKEYYDENGIS